MSPNSEYRPLISASAVAAVGDAVSCAFNLISDAVTAAGLAATGITLVECGVDMALPGPKVPRFGPKPRKPRKPGKPNSGPDGGPNGGPDGPKGGPGGPKGGPNGPGGPNGGCSFRADTEVLTEQGYELISKLNPRQDKVWSRNALTGQMDWKAVMAAYSNTYAETVYLKIRDVETGAMQTIVSNRIHPFFVQQRPNALISVAGVLTDRRSSEGNVYSGPISNGAWIDAADQKTGDRLFNHDTSWAEVISVRIEDRSLRAYNITVANTETYFVRGANNDNAQPVWVHNCDKRKKGRQKGKRYKSGDDSVQQYEEIENAQRRVHQGKSNQIIDSILGFPNKPV